MSKSAFYLMPHHRATLIEFRRVLKPGGRLLLVDYNRRTQRRFADAAALPCWTQWQLRDMVRGSGFEDCEILSTGKWRLGWGGGFLLPLLQELFGTWAIVMGKR
jgi:ubiquinone/menaquinone biosynthesis C-methylase UbiE